MVRHSWKHLATRIAHPDRAHYQDRRRGFLERYVSLEKSRGLEFGAFDLPTVPSTIGDCAIADVRSECHLAERFQVPLDEICPVDCIVEPGIPLPDQIDLRFDYVVLCHVLEHIPDVIGMVNQLAGLLVDGGILFIALPDKRQTPDVARSSTSLPRLIERNASRTRAASLSEIAEFSLAWRSESREEYLRSPRSFFESVMHELEHGEPDVHCNVWQDDEFFDQMRDLIRADYLDNLEIIGTHPAQNPFNEFYIAFRRCFGGVADSIEGAPDERPAPRHRSCSSCGHARFAVWHPSQGKCEASSASSHRYLSCRHCDLSMIDPFASSEETSEPVLVRMADTPVAGSMDSSLQRRTQSIEAIAEGFGLDRSRHTGRLMAVGPKRDVELAWLRDHRGWDAFGIDYAPHSLDPIEGGTGLAGTFDVALSIDSLPFAFDPLSELLFCHHLLRKDGRFILIVPHRDRLQASREESGPRPTDSFLFTPAVLERMLVRVGFVCESVSDGAGWRRDAPEPGSGNPSGSFALCARRSSTETASSELFEIARAFRRRRLCVAITSDAQTT